MEYEDIFGNSIQYVYNNEGQPVEITDTTGRKATIAWENEHITSIMDPMGQRTTYAYDETGRLTGVTTPDGNSVQYESV